LQLLNPKIIINDGKNTIEIGVDKEEAPKLEENEPCPHCGIRNPTGYLTCFSCHVPIDKTHAELAKHKRHTADTLNFIAQDKELSGKLLQLIEEANKRQTNGSRH